eukprot:3364096-Rhodomonas_salina.1
MERGPSSLYAFAQQVRICLRLASYATRSTDLGYGPTALAVSSYGFFVLCSGMLLLSAGMLVPAAAHALGLGSQRA